MSGGIYLLREDDELVEMLERPYDSEAVLQQLLAKDPSLLAGDQLEADAPRRGCSSPARHRCRRKRTAVAAGRWIISSSIKTPCQRSWRSSAAATRESVVLRPKVEKVEF
jgi:hypothetical protein